MGDKLVNYYKLLPKELQPKKVKNLGFKNHHVNFPCRILVSGKSNSGKTLSIMNFLRLCGSQFNKITIITKKIEPLYEMMKLQNPECCDIIQLADKGIFPNISDFDGSIQNFVIFDDLVNSDYMKNCKEFFIRGRKIKPYALNMCFITQDYFKTDSMLRKNMTNVWVFKPASRNEERNIERDHPIIKEYDGLWKQLNKKNPDDVNSFINIDCDSGDIRINFGNPLNENNELVGGTIDLPKLYEVPSYQKNIFTDWTAKKINKHLLQLHKEKEIKQLKKEQEQLPGVKLTPKERKYQEEMIKEARKDYEKSKIMYQPSKDIKVNETLLPEIVDKPTLQNQYKLKKKKTTNRLYPRDYKM